MAEDRRMTAAQVVDKLMSSEHADVVRESVAWVVAELMEAEVAGQIGAELGEIAPDRVTQRNGYRPRAWHTRAGEIELAIPKLRAGSYFPSFLEPRKRSEQALVAVVQEAYVNGVSTRKVDRLVEQLGVAAIGKDAVSRLCRGLDEQVRVFRERPLEVGIFPNDAALIRLAGSLLVEQNDEWLVSRRYLSQESLSSVLDENDHSPKEDKEVPALSAA